MRTIKLIAAAIILFAFSPMQAQISVNVNIGAPPAWAPEGYTEAEYYYIPDVEAYYDVRQTQFIYFGNGGWIRSRNLPNQYRNYDLYGGYKVVLDDYRGSRPYNNFKNHKIKYHKGYNGKHNNKANHNNHNEYADRGRHNEGGDYKKNGKGHKHKD